MTRLSIAATCLLVASVLGCAVSKTTYLPNGQKGHSINCSGTALTWGSCYEKAGKLCGERGYDVVAGGSEHGAIVSANAGSAFGSSIMQRSMLIQCKEG
jgi:hypothetical protein